MQKIARDFDKNGTLPWYGLKPHILKPCSKRNNEGKSGEVHFMTDSSFFFYNHTVLYGTSACYNCALVMSFTRFYCHRLLYYNYKKNNINNLISKTFCFHSKQLRGKADTCSLSFPPNQKYFSRLFEITIGSYNGLIALWCFSSCIWIPLGGRLCGLK